MLHWVKPPEGAAGAIARALRPGGRFVAEFGGKGNIRSMLEMLDGHPWYFPSIGEYATLLEGHGLEVATAALFPRPTKVEGDSGLRDWLKMFTSSFLPEDRIAEFENALRPRFFRDGAWFIDYMRLRVTARKPLRSDG